MLFNSPTGALVISESTGPIFTKFAGQVHGLYGWRWLFRPFQNESLKQRCYGNRLSARIGENWHTPPSFCALAFHNEWEDRNVDARFNTDDDPSTFTNSLVNFGPVTPEFCRRIRAGRATRYFATHF